jgi:hypothetical protein
MIRLVNTKTVRVKKWLLISGKIQEFRWGTELNDERPQSG